MKSRIALLTPGFFTLAVGATERQIIERGRHHRVWQRDHLVPLLDGEVNRPSGYTELAGNLHFWRDGQWHESRAEIEVAANGAAATEGAYQVQFAENINTAGAIKITLPDGQLFRTHLISLAFTDGLTGESTLIASVGEAEGWLLPPNQVLYPAAFGTVADARMIYRRSRFESDVIFRENPGSPANWNMDPETARLEVWHEIIEAPAIGITEHSDGILIDQTIDVGSARIGPGVAFTLGEPRTVFW